MALTLNKIAYDLLLIVRGGSFVSSEPISLNQIKYWISNTRARYIRNELNKSRTIDPFLIQDLGCIELEEVDRSECCATEVGCKFLRTKVKIPSSIELHHKNLLTRVGPIDKIGKPFDVIPYERVPYEFLNKFTKNTIKAFVMNNGGYVYIAVAEDNYKGKMLDVINIQGVFDDPTEMANFEACDSNKACYTDDSAYPIKPWMISQMKTDILKNNLLIMTQSPTDQVSDGSHGLNRPQNES